MAGQARPFVSLGALARVAIVTGTVAFGGGFAAIARLKQVMVLPGILPNPQANSCFPKAARTAGMSYDDLVNRVLKIACQRVGLSP